MPGYGIQGRDAGTGLLPWSWAVERLEQSHCYWAATVDRDGKPAAMPVWGVWLADQLWFSSSPNSRRARNLGRDPRCVITTDDPHEPVVVEATAERIDDLARTKAFASASNAKYETSYSVEFYASNALFAAAPRVVLALTVSDFTGSPTRWVFD